MKTLTSKYFINNKEFSFTELRHWCGIQQNSPHLASWEKSLHNFISEWLNDKEYIAVSTSGSTGEPKKISLSKRWVRASAKATISYFDLQPGNSILLSLPTHFIAGKLQVVRAFEGGMNLITVPPSSDPLQEIDDSIDFAAFTPQQVYGSYRKLSVIKKLIVGGGAISQALEEKLQTVDTEIYATYGMTETITHVAIRSVNRPHSEYFEALNGVSFAQNENNCLVISAPHIGVENLVTNDVVDLLGTRKFQFVGRLDNVVNSGGIKLFPEKIEKKLSAQLSAPFFISSLPHEKLGAQLVLVIESESEIENLQQLLSASLDRFEKPKRVFYTSRFERTETDKIQRLKTMKIIKK